MQKSKEKMNHSIIILLFRIICRLQILSWVMMPMEGSMNHHEKVIRGKAYWFQELMSMQGIL